MNPRLFVAVRTPDAALKRSIARERMVAATSGFFGLAGLVLAGIGLFGVAASAVAHRTSERQRSSQILLLEQGNYPAHARLVSPRNRS